MSEFTCIRPENVPDCLDALGTHGCDAALIAGGTDLHVLMKQGVLSPGVIIYIGGVGELKFLREEGTRFTIGALCTHSEIAGHSVAREVACLSLAAGSIGSPQVRNMATAGGNIATASPSGDLYPALLALDADLSLRSSRGERRVAVEDFAKGPGETTAEPDEMIESIAFDRPRGRFYSHFIKIGCRNALAISVASGAVVASACNGSIDEIRIACGAVAPTPIRMRDVERLVTGSRPSRALVEEAARKAESIASPITDLRATARYRRHVTGVIVSRLIEGALRNLTDYDGG